MHPGGWVIGPQAKSVVLSLFARLVGNAAAGLAGALAGGLALAAAAVLGAGAEIAGLKSLYPFHLKYTPILELQ